MPGLTMDGLPVDEDLEWLGEWGDGGDRRRRETFDQGRGEKLGYMPDVRRDPGLFVLHRGPRPRQVDRQYIKGAPIIINWFFVSSGFLITSLLLDENQRRADDIDRRRFYGRRALRLFPAMYAMLAVMAVILTVVQFVSPRRAVSARSGGSRS